MNWGNKIVVAFIFFAAFILFMVVQAFQQHTDLVAEDYYAQEIGYQKKLQQKANLEKSGAKVEVELLDEKVVLRFPGDHKPKGEIHFYHPSRKIFDQKLPIQLNDENAQQVDRKQLLSGMYRVNITWENKGVEYFQQEKIYLQ